MVGPISYLDTIRDSFYSHYSLLDFCSVQEPTKLKIDLTEDGKYITVRFNFDPYMISRCKSILGYEWDRGGKRWLFPATKTRAYKVYDTFRDAEFSDRFTAFLQSKKEEIPNTPIPKYKTEPWAHQVKAFNFAKTKFKESGGAILNLGMGCGKSKIALDLINNLEFKRSIIVCPAKVIDVWPYQANLHSDDSLYIHPLSTKDSTAKRAEKVRNILKSGKKIAIITNYEATRRKPIRDLFAEFQWDLLVLDECHRIKDPQGTDSKYFAKLAKEIKFKLGLTGTMLSNSPVDVFSQARFVRPEIFGKYFSRFRSEFCVMGGYGGHEILGFQNESELAGEIREFALEIKSEDVFPNLPKQHHIEHIISLDDKTKKIYDEWDKEFVVALENETISASNVLVKILKLQELTGGCIRNPETDKIHRISSEKKEAVREILEGLDPAEPIVIFCRFRQDIQAVSEAFEAVGRSFGELSGKKNDLAAWQNGNFTGLICQIGSGKYGIDLTRARYMCLYSIGYISPGDFDQVIKRQVRPGQKSDRVTIFHLVAKGTVDRKIYQALRRKEDIIKSIMEMAR